MPLIWITSYINTHTHTNNQQGCTKDAWERIFLFLQVLTFWFAIELKKAQMRKRDIFVIKGVILLMHMLLDHVITIKGRKERKVGWLWDAKMTNKNHSRVELRNISRGWSITNHWEKSVRKDWVKARRHNAHTKWEVEGIKCKIFSFIAPHISV